MSNEMNVFERIKGPTPNFFKRIVKIALSLAGAGTALLSAEGIITGFHLPDLIHKLAQWLIVGGLVATGIAKTTVNTSSDKPASPEETK